VWDTEPTSDAERLGMVLQSPDAKLKDAAIRLATKWAADRTPASLNPAR